MNDKLSHDGEHVVVTNWSTKQPLAQINTIRTVWCWCKRALISRPCRFSTIFPYFFCGACLKNIRLLWRTRSVSCLFFFSAYRKWHFLPLDSMVIDFVPSANSSLALPTIYPLFFFISAPQATQRMSWTHFIPQSILWDQRKWPQLQYLNAESERTSRKRPTFVVSTARF